MKANDTIRNPVHILWCLSLVLIRTLNTWLLDKENIDYLKSIIKSMKMFEIRMARVLGVG